MSAHFKYAVGFTVSIILLLISFPNLAGKKNRVAPFSGVIPGNTFTPAPIKPLEFSITHRKEFILKIYPMYTLDGKRALTYDNMRGQYISYSGSIFTQEYTRKLFTRTVKIFIPTQGDSKKYYVLIKTPDRNLPDIHIAELNVNSTIVIGN